MWHLFKSVAPNDTSWLERVQVSYRFFFYSLPDPNDSLERTQNLLEALLKSEYSVPLWKCLQASFYMSKNRVRSEFRPAPQGTNLQNLVRSILKELSSEESAVLLLVDLEGLNPEEAGNAMGKENFRTTELLMASRKKFEHHLKNNLELEGKTTEEIFSISEIKDIQVPPFLWPHTLSRHNKKVRVRTGQTLGKLALLVLPALIPVSLIFHKSFDDSVVSRSPSSLMDYTLLESTYVIENPLEEAIGVELKYTLGGNLFTLTSATIPAGETMKFPVSAPQGVTVFLNMSSGGSLSTIHAAAVTNLRITR